MTEPIRALCWDEATVRRGHYPDGIHAAVAAHLRVDERIQPTLACFDDPEQGLAESALAKADVLFWWGHNRHKLVDDAAVERIVRHVRERGMGFVPLHSSHESKPFQALTGRTGHISGWREDDRTERIYVIEPEHPCARGLPPIVVLPDDEMYCEPCDIPPPDTLVFLSTFEGGEVFRSGCAWQMGKGRVFYFRPGHETNRSLLNPVVGQVLRNAAWWAAKARCNSGAALSSAIQTATCWPKRSTKASKS